MTRTGGAPAGAASPWPVVGLLYVAGLLAAAQLGQWSALAPAISAALALPLTTMALAISVLEVGGASLGLVAGGLAQRLGLPTTLRLAMAALALAGLAAAAVQGTAGLFAARLLEAAGYLGVIVSAPVLIVRLTLPHGPRVLGPAMSLWSTFVPLGLALGAAAGSGVAALAGWRGAMAAGGVAAALLALALLRQRGLEPGQPGPEGKASASAPPASSGPPTPVALSAMAGLRAIPRPVWCLTLTFGIFALWQVGLLALLPTVLVQRQGMDAVAAGLWTALASASALPGSLLAAAWMKRAAGTPGFVRWATRALALSVALPGLLLLGVFAPLHKPVLVLAMALLANGLGGVYAALAFSLLPQVAGAGGQGEAGLVRANGLLAQCGASGSLLGPPLLAAAAQAGGWPAAAWVTAALALLALPLAGRSLPSR